MGCTFENHLQSMLGAWQEEGTGVEEWVPESEAEWAPPAPDQSGNYSAPALDRLLRAESPQEIELVRAELRERLALLDLSVQQGLDLPDDPIHLEIRGGFEQLLLAADTAELSLQIPVMRQAAIELAQTATNRLALAFARFAEHARQCMKLACPACGAENPRGGERCRGCGSPLPRPFDSLPVASLDLCEGRTGMTTPNYDRVADAVQAWRQGEMGDAELRDTLAGVRQNMLAHLRSLARDRADMARMRPEEARLYAALLEPIELAAGASAVALEEMLEGSLEAGMGRLEEATRRMVEAYLGLQAAR